MNNSFSPKSSNGQPPLSLPAQHGYSTIEQWRQVADQHTEWRELSLVAANRCTSQGAAEFCRGYVQWVYELAEKDYAMREQLVGMLFPKWKHDWSGYRKFEDWKNEFALHPAWSGRSSAEMLSDHFTGANAFGSAFFSWTNRAGAPGSSKAPYLTRIFSYTDYYPKLVVLAKLPSPASKQGKRYFQEMLATLPADPAEDQWSFTLNIGGGSLAAYNIMLHPQGRAAPGQAVWAIHESERRSLKAAFSLNTIESNGGPVFKFISPWEEIRPC